jgi:hypothetical protein
VAATIQLHHPFSPDLAFLYGTIVTDGGDHTISGSDYDLDVTSNICVFAEKEVRAILQFVICYNFFSFFGVRIRILLLMRVYVCMFACASNHL